MRTSTPLQILPQAQSHTPLFLPGREPGTESGLFAATRRQCGSFYRRPPTHPRNVGTLCESCIGSGRGGSRSVKINSLSQVIKPHFSLPAVTWHWVHGRSFCISELIFWNVTLKPGLQSLPDGFGTPPMCPQFNKFRWGPKSHKCSRA